MFANKRYYFAFLYIIFFIIGSITTSCSPKVGCPASQAATVQPNRKGELPSKRGKSELFGGNQSMKKLQRQRRKTVRKRNRSRGAT